MHHRVTARECRIHGRCIRHVSRADFCGLDVARAQDRGHPFGPARQQADLVAQIEQVFGEMRPDEAGAARDQDLHAGGG